MVFYLEVIFFAEKGYFSLIRPGLKIENLRYVLAYENHSQTILGYVLANENCSQTILGYILVYENHSQTIPGYGLATIFVCQTILGGTVWL